MVEQIYEEEYFTKAPYQPYRDEGHNKIRAQKIIDIAHPDTVLDVGCAYGFIVRRLLDQGIYAVGMDISYWCEQQSKEIIPHNFVRHDMREVPYPFMEKQFDLLYCEGVLEHIEEGYVERVMGEFERVSRERLLQISLSEHLGSTEPQGHICIKDHNWWFDRMPVHTWLFTPHCGIQDGNTWLYKG